jgi:Leucine-rich repeat (LRR) protein
VGQVVPEHIGLLTDLSILYLQDNQLSDLPAEIGLLTQLNTLACHNNRLKYIPREIGNCASLQVLTLNNNRLVDLPLELGDCRKLKSADLKDNPELMIPPPYVVSQGPPRICEYFLRIGKVKTLEDFSLDLAKYRLKGFPIELTYMGGYLRQLVLSNNIEIKTLPYEVGELTNLTILKMEGVKLGGRLTQGLGYLTALEELGLANNAIVSIPTGLGNATGLKVLDLDRNYVLELPPNDVQAKGYPLNFDFMKRLAAAERHGGLDLRNLKLSHIDFFTAAVCGHEIEILPEPLERGHPWTHLIALDLSANRLNQLGDILGDFFNLKKLICNGNRLEKLPDVFTRLTALELLHLADNAFKEFPGAVLVSRHANTHMSVRAIVCSRTALAVVQIAEKQARLCQPCPDRLEVSSPSHLLLCR